MGRLIVGVVALAASALVATGVGAAAGTVPAANGGGSLDRIKPLSGTFVDGGPLYKWSSSGGILSPDGRYLYYRHSGGDVGSPGVYVRDLVGGTELRIDSGPADPLWYDTVTAIDNDGRRLALSSTAARVAGDVNGRVDVYAYDTQDSTYALVSVLPDNTPSNWVTGHSLMSPDGRYVTFADYPDVSEAGTGDPAYYLRDVVAGTTAPLGIAATDQDRWPLDLGAMSADGSVVVMRKWVWNPAISDYDGRPILWDKASGATTDLLPGIANPRSGADPGSVPDLSADGRFVALAVAGSTRLVVLDRTTGQHREVALTPAGKASSGGTFSDPQISDDGRFVAFASDASDLVAGDTNDVGDLFVRDVVNGRTVRVNVTPSGADSESFNFGPSLTGISADGRTVAFASTATDLDPGPDEQNWDGDVFVRTFPESFRAPETILSGGPSGSITKRSSVLTFSSPLAGATFECRLDGAAYAACISPWTTPSLADGKHTFAVRAISGGLTDPTPATRSWTVDNVAPNTSFVSGPTSLTNDFTPTFGFKASESGVTYSCKVDSGGWYACTSPWTTRFLGLGQHTVAVRAKDAVGHTDPTPAKRNLLVDYKRPQTTITSGPPATTADRTPTLRFTSSEAGSTFQCRVDKGSWISCRSGWTTRSLPRGKHVLTVRAKDKAGNVDATPATRTTTVR